MEPLKKILFYLFVIFTVNQVYTQTNNPPQWSWAQKLSGTYVGSCTNSNGESFVVGTYSGSVTIGSTTLSSGSVYVAKFDSDGLLVWARDAASGSVTPYDIATDALGNYYLTGSFSTTVSLGSVSLTSAGLTDLFIVKYDNSGASLWAQQAGGTSSDRGNAISIDNSGNVFVATSMYLTANAAYSAQVRKYDSSGTFLWSDEDAMYNSSAVSANGVATDQYGNCYFTGYTYYASFGGWYFFIAKTDPDGNTVWIRRATGTSGGGMDIACDEAGNTYSIGSFGSSVTFGTSTISSSGVTDIFLVKYDAAGQVSWVKRAGGVDTDEGQGVALDANGNIVITGKFQQNAVFGPFSISNVNSGVADMYVAKYSSLGDELWVSNAGSAGVDGGHRIDVDLAGNAYISGTFSTAISFGTTNLSGGSNVPYLSKIGIETPDTLSIETSPLTNFTYVAGTQITANFTTTGTFDADNHFTLQLSDASGGFFYPVNIGTGTSSPISGVIPVQTIAASAYRVRVISSNPEVLGTDNGSNISINSSSLQITPDWTWSKKLDGSVVSIATDSIGGNYVLGTYSGSATFGSTTLTGGSVYVAKYDTDGQVQWARNAGVGTITPADIVVDATGNYYITGRYQTAATFGAFNLSPTATNQTFVVKYNDSGTELWAVNVGTQNTTTNLQSIAVDVFGNVFVSTEQGASPYTFNLFKYDQTGAPLWNTSYGSHTSINALINNNAVSTDGFGNSYVAGNYYNGSTYVFFLSKRDPDGNGVWTRTVNGSIHSSIDLAVDNSSNSYVTGAFSSAITFGSTNLTPVGATDMYLVKYDAAGQVVWAKSGGGVDTDYGVGVAVSKTGHVYVSGIFQHAGYFSSINISNFNSGCGDVFVAKYTDTGNSVWVKQAGETYTDKPVKIGTDKDGACYVPGKFGYSINFGSASLSGGQSESFLAKIDSSYQRSIGKASILAGTDLCAGNVVKIEYPIAGVFNSGNTFTAQLSDENGSFASPTNIGSVSTALNNTIYAVIPDVTAGTAYRIRVVSSDQPLTGLDNGANISINQGHCDSVVPVLEMFPIVAGEYFFDTDPGLGNGTPIAVTQADSISLSLSISVTGLSEGFHNLFIRCKDSKNIWSLYEGRVIYIQPADDQTTVVSSIESGEYFFDTDPGVGNGTPLASFATADSISITRQISVTGLTEGFHNLFIRMKDTANVWSMYEGRIVYVQPVVTQTVVSSITAAEYFFNTDPGVGNGTALASFTEADSINILRQISTSGLPTGYNNLFIRVKDTMGVWSLYEGRKFFICTDVLPTPAITGAASVCSGSDLQLDGTTVTGATSYLWKGPGGFTQSGTSLLRTNANTSMNGTYRFYAIRSGGTICDSSSATVEVDVKPVFTSNNPQTICSGDSYTFNGHTYSSPGNYNDTLTAMNGCDSVVVTQLTVNPVYNVSNPQSICQGDSYSINGNTYTSSGTYVDVMSSILGCDSTVTTVLTVNPVYSVNNPQTICTGNSYTINGNTYTASGTYTDILTSTQGCDSTVITQLTVVNSFSVSDAVSICQGDSYSIGTSTYTTAGTYTDVLTSTQGCDSIVTTTLTVNPTYTISINPTICQGDSYTVGSSTYTASGTYVDVLTSVNGCDSTITTVLTVIQPQTTNNPQAICQGDSYSIGGNTYTVAGTYTDLLQNINGCDSTVITQLTVFPVYSVNNPVTICSGDTYTIGSNSYSTAGTYVDVLSSVNGCDSTVTTILSVNPVFSSTNPQTICSGDSYSIGGNTYTTAGTYTDVLQAVNGCDSTVTTILTVNQSYSVNNPQIICQGDSYTIGGNTYTTAGSYTNVFQTVNGCDSIVNTQLTVRPVFNTNNPQTICAGESYTINGNTYTTAGNYTDVFQAVNGCDSTVHTQLTVNSVTLNLSVGISSDGLTLTANQTNATYQWIDCGNNNVQISGATSQSFTPLQNGNYAVILTSTICDVSDTTLCYNVDNVGLAQMNSLSGFTLYPNPINDRLTIELSQDLSGKLSIYNSNGQVVYTSDTTFGSKIEVDAADWSFGVYHIEFTSNGAVIHRKVVKQ